MTTVRMFLCFAAAALAASCSKGHGEEAGATAEKPHDFIRYDPGHVPVDFVKIVTVEEGSGATSVALPGRVSFDEDRTQRVASPIDGRAVAILVKLGDKVRAGQPLISLSSPNAGQIQAEAKDRKSVV